jgi:UDP-glucose 4-epimerase
MPESSEKSLQYQAQRSIDTNISGSYNLIKALRPRLTGVCLASTVDVYGNASVPIDETHPVAPDTWYAASKLAMELYVAIELRDALPLAILRLSHIYGPGDPRPKAVRAFVDAVRSGVPPVIYGDGADLRDYIHVKDVAECIVRVLQVKARGIFNVATGRSLSLKAFAELAIKAGGRGMLPVYRQRRYPRKDYRFDVRKINSVLDFPPSVSIEQGIAELMSS